MNKVSIIGAGLSGLSAAYRLHRAGIDIELIEAASRYGGRIKSAPVHGDLGPSWVWPPFQAVAQRWISELGIAPFEQFDQGKTIVQRTGSAAVEHHFVPGQQGISRLTGGPQSLVDNVLIELPSDCLHLNEKLVQLEPVSDGVQLVSIRTDKSQSEPVQRFCNRAILAIPPRMAASIDFVQALPEELIQIMRSSPTWMAAQAKVVVRYEAAFWRKQGLSGRLVSQAGPLVEVHDHCDASGELAALFGFVGISAGARASQLATLEKSIIEQLVQCFGADAAEPVAIHIEDWALNKYICSDEDIRSPGPHPAVAPSLIRQAQWQNRLFLAGSESADLSPGLIEGALQAGEKAAQAVMASMQK